MDADEEDAKRALLSISTSTTNVVPIPATSRFPLSTKVPSLMFSDEAFLSTYKCSSYNDEAGWFSDKICGSIFSMFIDYTPFMSMKLFFSRSFKSLINEDAIAFGVEPYHLVTPAFIVNTYQSCGFLSNAANPR